MSSKDPGHSIEELFGLENIDIEKTVKHVVTELERDAPILKRGAEEVGADFKNAGKLIWDWMTSDDNPLDE